MSVATTRIELKLRKHYQEMVVDMLSNLTSENAVMKQMLEESAAGNPFKLGDLYLDAPHSVYDDEGELLYDREALLMALARHSLGLWAAWRDPYADGLTSRSAGWPIVSEGWEVGITRPITIATAHDQSFTIIDPADPFRIWAWIHGYREAKDKDSFREGFFCSLEETSFFVLKHRLAGIPA